MRALEAFPDQPKAIIADTIKGAGVSFMQHTALAPDQEFYKFHSGAPGPENYTRACEELDARVNAGLAAVEMGPIAAESADRVAAPAADGLMRLIPAYGDALLEHAHRDPTIVALDGDLMIDCGLLKFRDAFGERFFECGIAEQDMVSTAGALALSGKLPVVHSFACFLSTRPNEQIFNNGTERTKIVYVGSLAGLVPGGPGHSHQSIRDIGVLGNVPGLVLIEPATPAEVAEVLSWCLTQNRVSSYLRLISVPWKAPSEPQGPLVFGKGREIRKGRDVVLVGYGPILLSEAEKAASQIEQATGLRVGIINLPWLNAVDAGWLHEATRDAKLVVSLDNHSTIGGQGDRIAAALATARTHAPLLRLSVEGIAECGTPAEVLAHHGIDAAGIATAAAKAVGQQR
jgi:transketolase